MQQNEMVAVFSDGRTPHFAVVPYPFLHHKGDRVQVVYEAADPNKAAVYSLFGYWLRAGEVAASLFIAIALYWVAASVTKNPTPEAMIEELEMGKIKPKKPKYD